MFRHMDMCSLHLLVEVGEVVVERMVGVEPCLFSCSGEDKQGVVEVLVVELLLEVQVVLVDLVDRFLQRVHLVLEVLVLLVVLVHQVAQRVQLVPVFLGLVEVVVVVVVVVEVVEVVVEGKVRGRLME